MSLASVDLDIFCSLAIASSVSVFTPAALFRYASPIACAIFTSRQAFARSPTLSVFFTSQSYCTPSFSAISFTVRSYSFVPLLSLLRRATDCSIAVASFRVAFCASTRASRTPLMNSCWRFNSPLICFSPFTSFATMTTIAVSAARMAVMAPADRLFNATPRVRKNPAEVLAAAPAALVAAASATMAAVAFSVALVQ